MLDGSACRGPLTCQVPSHHRQEYIAMNAVSCVELHEVCLAATDRHHFPRRLRHHISHPHSHIIIDTMTHDVFTIRRPDSGESKHLRRPAHMSPMFLGPLQNYLLEAIINGTILILMCHDDNHRTWSRKTAKPIPSAEWAKSPRPQAPNFSSALQPSSRRRLSRSCCSTIILHCL